MKARHKRFILIAIGLALLGLAAMLILNAFQSNMVFFYTPTQVHKGEVPHGTGFRIGGLVVEDSLKRQDDGLTVHFSITDTAKIVPVVYKGVLPDLFKEGKGVVAQGKVGPDGIFVASEVLAKHDENYMPPEAAEALKRAQEQGKTVVMP
ncbi:MAG: cytochrome c maturation protein CcmE [Methylotenera sp.]|uniref:cytochrome c maturation protein CcmE n=1 Tax=Methylotenera sp. TaxID=2051956 RepID=UPI0024879031|nr:cytochrome c maturation protein CcmE [Methylotenera sp.]MDI1310163.1 cytochrome c maturation protein CcmE [Methylotenera sp.]